MKIRSVLVLLFGAVVLLHAQEEVAPAIPPMPPGPPVQLRAPDFSQWVVQGTLNSAQPASAPASTGTDQNKAAKPDKESQVTMVKTGKIMLRQRVNGLGGTWDAWCIDDVQITVYPDGKNLVVQTRPSYIGAANPLYEDYSQTDFPACWWVTARNYAGMKRYNGKSCLYFKNHLSFYKDYAPGNVEAYTDVKTRFPVAVIVTLPYGQEIYSYEFQPPPATELTPPENVKSALDDHHKAESATRINLPP